MHSMINRNSPRVYTLCTHIYVLVYIRYECGTQKMVVEQIQYLFAEPSPQAVWCVCCIFHYQQKAIIVDK